MSDRKPIFNVPLIVVVLSAIMWALHLVRSILPVEQDLWLLLSLALIPARYSASEYVIPGGEWSAFFSPITHMLVHGDMTHLIVNSLWLLAFGSAIAKRAGSWSFLAFSCLCGFGGVAAHLLGHWGSITPMVGASAAIAGQMAAVMRLFFGAMRDGQMHDLRHDPRSVRLMSVKDALSEPRMLAVLGIWIGFNIALGFGIVEMAENQSIAWEAHIGGFIVGLLLFDQFDRPHPINDDLSHPL